MLQVEDVSGESGLGTSKELERSWKYEEERQV
jgi:hypothetical protein